MDGTLARLEGALPLIHGAHLDKRIIGLNDIKDIVVCIEEKEWKRKQRSSALSYISSVVGANEFPTRSSASTASRINVTISAEECTQWLLDNQIIDDMLNPQTTHIELIRRVLPLCRLLASQKRLTNHHLGLLWSLATSEQHESVEHLIYDILSKLTPCLLVPQLKYLFKRFSEKPSLEYDVQFLALLRDFSKQAFSIHSTENAANPQKMEMPLYALETFWALIQLQFSEETSLDTPQISTETPEIPVVSSEILKKAEEYFLELLSSEYVENERTRFIERCIFHVQAGKHTASALSLLMKIIQTYRTNSSGWFTNAISQSTIIESLEIRFSLLHLIMNDMMMYKQKAIESLSKISDSPLETEQLIAFHVNAMQIRQKVLVHVLTQSSLSLSIPQCDAIWETSVERALSALERDSCFAWLTVACDGTSSLKGLDDTAIAYLFTEKILPIPPSSYTRMSFLLLLKYFLHVNIKKGYLRADDRITRIDHFIFDQQNEIIEKDTAKLSNTLNALISVSPFKSAISTKVPAPTPILPIANNPIKHFDSVNLHLSAISVLALSEIEGINVLWMLLMKNEDDEVALGAISVLNALHSNLSRALRSSESTIREDHLRSCLSSLMAALKESQQNARESSFRVVSRCVTLLKSFLTGYSQQAEMRTISLSIHPTKDLRVEPFILDLNFTDTLNDIRRIVFEKVHAVNLGVQLKSLLISVDSRRLTVWHQSLSNLPLKDGDIIDVHRISDTFFALSAVGGQYSDQAQLAFAQVIPANYPSVTLLALPDVSKDTDKPQQRSKSGDSTYLRSLSHDAEIYDKLMSLLTHDSSIGMDVWDILILSPLNATAVKRFILIDSINAQDWTELLDATSKPLYHILYALKIIDYIVHNRLPDDPDFAVDRAHWCLQFINKQGLTHLLLTLTSPSLQVYNRHRHGPKTIYYRTLEYLFSLVHTFCCMDPAYSSVTQPFPVDVHVVRGSLVSSKGFDLFIERAVCEAIIPAVLYMEADSEKSELAAYYGDVEEIANEEAFAQDMVNSALRLLNGAVQVLPNTLPRFCSHSGLDDFIRLLLLHTDDESSRIHAAKTLYNLVKSANRSSISADCRFTVISRVIALASPVLLLKYRNHSEHMFLLLNQFAEDILNGTQRAFSTELRDLLANSIHQLSAFLYSLTSEESYDSIMKADPLIVGILSFIRVLTQFGLFTDAIEAERLALFIYNKALMDTPTADAPFPLCRSCYSRPAGYALLLELCKAHEIVHSSILDACKNSSFWTKSYMLWSYDPASLIKESTRPVGLKNQGSTCYMNSFVQQLFNVTPFRNSILKLRRNDETLNEYSSTTVFSDQESDSNATSANDSLRKSSTTDEDADGRSGNEHTVSTRTRPPSLLRSVTSPPSVQNRRSMQPDPFAFINEFQLLFAHLALSQRGYVDPLPLCKALPDYGGGSMNLNEQRDVNEFAAQLFEKLEQELRQSSHPHILSETFKGKIINQIISRECPHRSEREEDFFMVSLTVKNKRTLQQSLDLYVQGDLLDDTNKWLCSSCNGRVTAVKRTCLSTSFLPNYLILHLKRFEFDFDAMKKIKINDYFEFPMELDVEPYTTEGLTRREKILENGSNSSDPSSSQSSNIPLPSLRRGISDIADALASSNFNRINYSLKGILVHTGVADAGHYYSFVRGASSESGWIEYNDTIIKPFDPALIPRECFGGMEKVEMPKNSPSKEQVNIRNAYMLIYERQVSEGNEASERAEISSMELSRSLSGKPFNPSVILRNFSEMHASKEESPQHISTIDEESTNLTSNIETRATKADDSSPSRECDGATALVTPPPLLSAPPYISCDRPPTAGLLSPTGNHVSNDSETSVASTQKDPEEFSRIIPSAIAEIVHRENVNFLMDRHVFDFSFNIFLFNLSLLRSGIVSSLSVLPTPTPVTTGSNFPVAHAFPTSLPSSAQSSPRNLPNLPQALTSPSHLSIPVPTPPTPTSRRVAKLEIPIVEESAIIVSSSHNPETTLQCTLSDLDIVKVVHCATLFTFKILAHSNDNGSFIQWMDFLTQIYTKSAPSRAWLLNYCCDHSVWTHNLLFSCPMVMVRDAFAQLILTVISTHRADSSERASYQDEPYSTTHEFSDTYSTSSRLRGRAHSMDDTRKPHSDWSKKSNAENGEDTISLIAPATDHMEPISVKTPNSPSLSVIIRFFKQILDWLPTSRRHSKSYGTYFRLWFQLARLGKDERRWMVNAGCVGALISFYKNTDPLTHFNVKPAWNNEPAKRIHPPSMQYLIQLLVLLIRSSTTDTLPGHGPSPTQASNRLLPLPKADRDVLLAGIVYQPEQLEGVAENGVISAPNTPTSQPTKLATKSTTTIPFIPFLLTDRTNSTHLADIVMHWSWENKAFSSAIIEMTTRCLIGDIPLPTIVNGIPLVPMDGVGTYISSFRLLASIMSIKDSLLSWRLDKCLPSLCTLLRRLWSRRAPGDDRLLIFGIRALLQLSYDVHEASKWLHKREKDWLPIVSEATS